MIKSIAKCLSWLLVATSFSNYAVTEIPIDQPLPVLLQGDYRSDDLHKVLNSELIYQADFSSMHSIAQEWQLEGTVELNLKGDALQFKSALSDDFIHAYQQNKFDFIPNQLSQYHQVLGQLAETKLAKDDVQAMRDDAGKFKGGHIVLWNKQTVPDSYIVEFDLQHQSPMGLFILFFSATGLEGESIFSPQLAKRNGVFSQYTRGDLTSYHISTYTPHRARTNLRKNNKGGKLLKSKPDLAALAPQKNYKYRLIKWQNRFQLYLNDQLQMDYQDNDNALEGGHIGLRLMASARAQVSQFKLYKLKQNPFSQTSTEHQITVSNSQQLIKALKEVTPGTTVWLESGQYPDVAVELNRSGTLDKRIYIKAKEPGKVLFSGKPSIKINASYITLSGIRFVDGNRFDNSPYVKNKGNLIEKKAPFLVDMQGSNNRLSQCAIDNFDLHHSTWINVEGSKNRIDHCTFVNKLTHGGVISVSNPPAAGAFHRFDHNYFSRPDINSDNAEVVRLATGWSHNINAHMTVEYNMFERCDGEGEVLSDKSSRNTIRLNRFINNQGGLSLRQGTHTHVYGNWFYRQHDKPSAKKPRDFGMMIRGTEHLLENNHFEGDKNLVKLVNGQPLGYKKPGRPAELPRHHIAAERVKLRHNDFIVKGALAEIDQRRYQQDRSVLAHNIDFTNNLIVASAGWSPTSKMPYPEVKWQQNAIVGAKQPQLPNNHYYPSIEALPKAHQQRFGSQPLVDYLSQHQTGAAWQAKPLFQQ